MAAGKELPPSMRLQWSSYLVAPRVNANRTFLTRASDALMLADGEPCAAKIGVPAMRAQGELNKARPCLMGYWNGETRRTRHE